MGLPLHRQKSSRERAKQEAERKKKEGGYERVGKAQNIWRPPEYWQEKEKKEAEEKKKRQRTEGEYTRVGKAEYKYKPPEAFQAEDLEKEIEQIKGEREQFRRDTLLKRGERAAEDIQRRQKQSEYFIQPIGEVGKQLGNQLGGEAIYRTQPWSPDTPPTNPDRLRGKPLLAQATTKGKKKVRKTSPGTAQRERARNVFRSKAQQTLLLG